jgi:hypothetical protein
MIARRWAAAEKLARAAIGASDVVQRTIGVRALTGLTGAVRLFVSDDLMPSVPGPMPRAQLQLGPAGPGHRLFAAEQVLDRGGGDQRPRPQRVGGDAVLGELGGEPQGAQRHPVLGDRVADVRPEPARLQADRRGQGHDVRVRRPLQVRDAGPADHERAAGVDGLHQVVAPDLQRLGAGQVDGRGVVDAHVDPAEHLGGLRDRAHDLGLVADVADDRQRAPARRLDLLGSRVHRPVQLGVRLGGLGDQRDVGTVPRRPDRDRQADAAVPAGNEQGLALERHLGPYPERGVAARFGQLLAGFAASCSRSRRRDASISASAAARSAQDRPSTCLPGSSCL